MSTAHRTIPVWVIGLSAAVVLALVLGVVLWWDRDGDGRPEAEGLAAALSTGDFEGVALTEGDADTAAEEYERMVAPLVEATEQRPEVSLEELGPESDGARSAVLRWTWTLPEEQGTWSFTTEAPMQRGPEGWTIGAGPEVIEASLGPQEHLDLDPVAPEAGTITDREGTELYGPREVRNLGLDKAQLPEAELEDTARRLAELLGIDEDNYVEKIGSYGPEAFVPALTIRVDDEDEYPLERIRELPGFHETEESRPLALERGYAPGVLGQLREATQEDIEDSDGEIREGDLVGSGGVVADRTEELAGVRGAEVVAVDADTGERRSLHRVEAEDGTEVRTTLDDDLQRLATDAIADTDAPSAVVVMQPSSGDVLASALGPAGQEYPVGLVGQYAPGSTFKVVTALSLLREGDTPDTGLDCPGTTSVDGMGFKNADSMSPDLFGPMTLEEVVAHSCNTALLQQHDRISPEELADAAATLGIGQEAPEGLDAFMGSIDPEAEGTAHAASMIGQGTVLASPLSMAVMLSSVQAGETVRPRILADDETDASEPAPEQPLTEDETEQLQQMLRAVVTDGSLDALADVPGEPLMGKTGTAEWTDDGTPRLHSWVVVAQGDLVVAVFVETGSYGSVTAGPIAREVVEGAAAS